MLRGVVLHCCVLYCVSVLYCPALYRIVLCGIASYCISLYLNVMQCDVLLSKYNVVFYCTVLNYMISCGSVFIY